MTPKKEMCFSLYVETSRTFEFFGQACMPSTKKCPNVNNI